MSAAFTELAYRVRRRKDGFECEVRWRLDYTPPGGGVARGFYSADPDRTDLGFTYLYGDFSLEGMKAHIETHFAVCEFDILEAPQG